MAFCKYGPFGKLGAFHIAEFCQSFHCLLLCLEQSILLPILGSANQLGFIPWILKLSLAIKALSQWNILAGASAPSSGYSSIRKPACQEFPVAAGRNSTKWWFTLRLQQKPQILQTLQILQCKKSVAGFKCDPLGNPIQLFSVRKKCCCVAML